MAKFHHREDLVSMNAVDLNDVDTIRAFNDTFR